MKDTRIDLKMRMSNRPSLHDEMLENWNLSEFMERTADTILDISDIGFLVEQFGGMYHSQKWFRPKLRNLSQEDKIIVSHHVAILMDIKTYAECRAYDLADIECEYVGLDETYHFVKERFPYTPIKRLLVQYANEQWWNRRKPYVARPTNMIMFMSFKEVLHRLCVAYKCSQRKTRSYMVSSLPPEYHMTDIGWEDTFGDMKQCLHGYQMGDFRFAATPINKNWCCYGDCVSQEQWDMFCSEIDNGTFDNMMQYLRFANVNPAGLLVSHLLGLLPCELVDVVVWYLEAEVDYDKEYVESVRGWYGLALNEWSGCLDDWQDAEHSMKTGQCSNNLCVRCIKRWRQNDTRLHNLRELDSRDFGEVKPSHVKSILTAEESDKKIYELMESPHDILIGTCVLYHDYHKKAMIEFATEQVCLDMCKWYHLSKSELEDTLVCLCR